MEEYSQFDGDADKMVEHDFLLNWNGISLCLGFVTCPMLVVRPIIKCFSTTGRNNYK